MNSEKIYFHQKIKPDTLKELNEYLKAHPNNEVSYWDWREALELYAKVSKELADSVKAYGKAYDKLLKENHINEINSYEQAKRDLMLFNLNNVNRELSKLVVEPNQEIETKLLELRKKYYVVDSNSLMLL